MTPAAAELLVAIADAERRGERARPKHSLARTWLRVNGYIVSKPPNHNPLLPAISGQACVWYPTDGGRAVAAMLREAPQS